MNPNSFKYSPVRSPKLTFNLTQSDAQPTRGHQSGNKRQSPGTVKKNHPYTDTMSQSNVFDKPTKVLKQSVDELEFYRQKCKELEQSLQQMNQFVQGRNDQPLEAYIRENAGLHLELEKVAKQLSQKRNEADLWKQKYENQLSQLMQVKANYELEIQSLSEEVQRLLLKSDDYEYDKQRQIEDVQQYLEKNQQQQMETLKVQLFQQTEMMENQVRKLRDQVNEKDNEIDDLANKLDRQINDSDNEMQRLLKDNEVLRYRINQIEVERQKELESLRNKLEGYSYSTLDNLRKTHNNSIEVLESEIDKLRALLEIKNAEIETLIQQNNKVKSNSDTQISEIRLEVECLKSKLIDGEHYHRAQLEDLQIQMQDEQESDMNQLNQNFERIMGTLEQEINSLQTIIHNKNEELQQQIRDKTNQREYYENQSVQLNFELEEQKQHQFNIEREKNRQIEGIEDEIQNLRIQGQEQKDQLKSQVQFLEGEIQRLKELAHQKNKDLEQQVNQFSLLKKTLDDDVRALKHENDVMRSRLNEFERSRSNEFEELKHRTMNLDQQFREKARQYEIKIEGLLMELKRSKEQHDIRSSDLENALQTRQSYEKECRRLKEENEALKGTIISNDRDKVHDLEDQRSKLEASSSYQIDNLKTAFNTQLNILHQENIDLKNINHNKDKDIQDLLDKYQSLDQAVSTGQFGPEVIANRSIYDVYVRTKTRMPSSNKKKTE